MAKISQLIAGGFRLGKELKTNGATIEPGLLVKLDTSGSTVSLNTINNNPLGWAFGHRYGAYRPTTRVFATDEALVVIWGEGEALLSSDFFSGGSLPAAGDTLYAQANGLWGMSGSAKVGSCIAGRNVDLPTGGVGTTQAVAHIRFNIVP